MARNVPLAGVSHFFLQVAEALNKWVKRERAKFDRICVPVADQRGRSTGKVSLRADHRSLTGLLRDTNTILSSDESNGW
jgi:hypothetical protein